MRRSPLKRRAALPRRVQPLLANPRRDAWKKPRTGICASCTKYTHMPLHGHHVVSRQTVARMNGDEWDPANRLDLCDKCHFEHEYGCENRKLSRMLIPPAAVKFATDLMGEDVAMAYFLRHYREVEA